jgi:hypothetical protein
MLLPLSPSLHAIALRSTAASIPSHGLTEYHPNELYGRAFSLVIALTRHSIQGVYSQHE